MKDIDFEELDKAVSSLLAKKGSPPHEPDSGNPLPASEENQSPGSAPAVAAPATEPTEPPANPMLPSKSPANRSAVMSLRSGRVMDMVRPSSLSSDDKPDAPPPKLASVSSSGRLIDMVRPSPLVSPEASTSESSSVAAGSKQVQPINEHVVPDPITPLDESNEAIPETPPEIVKPELEPDTNDTADHTWPDPLALHGFVDDGEPVEGADLNNGPKPLADSVTPEPTAAVVPASEVPAASPFLADTKVEKRPLGAYAEAAAPNPPENKADNKTGDKLEDKPAAAPVVDEGLPADTASVAIEQPLPPELENDIVAVEANDNNLEKNDTLPSLQAPSLATMSIPQQYKDGEAKDTHDDNQLFDTKEYHAPIPVAEHKGSGKTTLILLAILLLTVAGGAIYWWLYLR